MKAINSARLRRRSVHEVVSEGWDSLSIVR